MITFYLPDSNSNLNLHPPGPRGVIERVSKVGEMQAALRAQSPPSRVAVTVCIETVGVNGLYT
jgi:hypothetical protein